MVSARTASLNSAPRLTSSATVGPSATCSSSKKCDPMRSRFVMASWPFRMTTGRHACPTAAGFATKNRTDANTSTTLTPQSVARYLTSNLRRFHGGMGSQLPTNSRQRVVAHNMVFTHGPLSRGKSFGHERQFASVTFCSDGDGGTPSISVQAANLWYDIRGTYIVYFVADGCRKNLPLSVARLL